MEHTDKDGLLNPPTSQEQTDLPVAELSKRPLEMVRLTMDEADELRARRTFDVPDDPLCHDYALPMALFVIANIQEGRERSQALGQINAVVVWAKWAGQKNKS